MTTHRNGRRRLPVIWGSHNAFEFTGRTGQTDSFIQHERLNTQTLDYASVDEMFIDDFIEIILVDIGVPDPFRIHDDSRPQFTTTETPGDIDTHATFAVDAEFLGAFFDIVAHRARIKIRATTLTGFTLIGTEKSVITINTHKLHHYI